MVPPSSGWPSSSCCVTAGYVGWEYWTETKANKSGDDFSAALLLANDGKADEALAALDALEKDGYGAYPLLARMRAATVLFEKGDFAGAVADFDEVSSDTSIPEAIRDMARLRAALILVDKGSYEDVSSRAEQLTYDTNTLRHSAREALGLSAWKAGKPRTPSRCSTRSPPTRAHRAIFASARR